MTRSTEGMPMVAPGLERSELERLALLMTVCGEVTRAAGTVLRDGYDWREEERGPTNKEELERGVGRFVAVLGLMVRRADMSETRIGDWGVDLMGSLGPVLRYNTFEGVV